MTTNSVKGSNYDSAVGRLSMAALSSLNTSDAVTKLLGLLTGPSTEGSTKIDLSSVDPEGIKKLFFYIYDPFKDSLSLPDILNTSLGDTQSTPNEEYISAMQVATLDMFSLIILSKKCDVKKEKCIQIIKAYMSCGGKRNDEFIYNTVFYELFEKNNTSGDAVLKKIIETIQQKQVGTPPLCPMSGAEDLDPWINGMWDFLERRVEPLFSYES